jgi:hypothetical protein
MNKKRKAGENEETDRSKRSNVAQDPGKQPASAAGQVPTGKAAARKTPKAADASQQEADEQNK